MVGFVGVLSVMALGVGMAYLLSPRYPFTCLKHRYIGPITSATAKLLSPPYTFTSAPNTCAAQSPKEGLCSDENQYQRLNMIEFLSSSRFVRHWLADNPSQFLSN